MKGTDGIHVVNYNRQEYERLQDLARDKAGVSCTIKVFPDKISIRTQSFSDYILAKAVLKGRSSKAIERDVFGEKEAVEHSTNQ